jgi:peptidoglycan/LPS O-acetylase OafA/YrhL
VRGLLKEHFLQVTMKNEIKSLTGLRGVAAAIVMLYHFGGTDTYLRPYVPHLIRHGFLGVDVFFVLSGFVMALTYSALFKDGIAGVDYKLFMVKRLARIYPLYFLVTLIFVVKYELNLSGVWPDNFHAADFIACLLMIQAWGFGFANVAGATWSLSTEFFAYIIFPVLARCAVLARPAYAMGVALMVATSLSALVLSDAGFEGPLDVVAWDSILPLLRCLAGFCIGLLSYRVAMMNGARKPLSSSMALFVVVAALLLAAHVEATDWVLFALFPALVIMLFYEPALARLMFGNRFVRHLGLVSYSLYLVHPLFIPVKARLTPLAVEVLGDAAHPLVFAAVVLASWGFACGLYRFIEVPGRAHFQRVLLRPRVAEVPS